MRYIQLFQHSSTLSTACASQHSSLVNPVSTDQPLINTGQRWSTLVNVSQRYSPLIDIGHTDQGIQQVKDVTKSGSLAGVDNQRRSK